MNWPGPLVVATIILGSTHTLEHRQPALLHRCSSDIRRNDASGAAAQVANRGLPSTAAAPASHVARPRKLCDPQLQSRSGDYGDTPEIVAFLGENLQESPILGGSNQGFC